ncbi:solute carrier family 43 member 3-like [Pecten maximus]|uniref:solute carrier family 43 member 3-like n=1 Tax=Pecten maximus TaxID=6579 RepID=UPI001459139F|nr:solute carrier family 43 member 3-like [Pecten maximus]
MRYDGWRKYLVAGWAIIETFLFAGLLYGWAPMVWIFKQEGVYADLCPDSTNVSYFSYHYNMSTVAQSTYNVMTMGSSSPAPKTTADKEQDFKCPPQDDKFALAFTIGSAIFCASSAAYGITVYKTGTRMTRTIAMVMFFGGATMLAFVDKEKPWLVFPGLTIMGVGGLPVLITNAQISNLFVKGSSTFIGLLCGAYDASSSVLLIIKLAYEKGFHSQYSYGILAALHVLVAVSTFVFLPKDRIRKQEKSNPTDEEEHVESCITEIPNIQDTNTSVYGKTTEPLNGDLDMSEKRHPSLKSCILSNTYILHVLWVCILQLRFYYFLGTMNSYLTRITDNNKLLVSHFTNTMMYTMVGGAVSSSFAGVLYDWQRKIFSGRRSHIQRQLLPSILPMGVGSCLGILLSLLVLLPSLDILYVDFIVMTLLRSFLYSAGTTFLTTVFPSEYFEMLYGIMIISAGIFGCLQFALFTWSQSYLGAILHSDVFCICLTATSLIHPIYHWVKCRRVADFVLDKY